MTPGSEGSTVSPLHRPGSGPGEAAPGRPARDRSDDACVTPPSAFDAASSITFLPSGAAVPRSLASASSEPPDASSETAMQRLVPPPGESQSGNSAQSGSSVSGPRADGLHADGPRADGPRAGGHEHVLRSDTVINTGSPRAALLPPEEDSPASRLMQRLFPPWHDGGSSAGSFSPEGIELGQFRIEERIGMGGMGAVFRAVDTRLQRLVALKLLAPSQCHDPASVKRFQNEARAAARLDHDNVARVFYIGEDQGLHFISFEFITGSNVREVIRRRGRLNPVDTVNYSLQIAYALKHTSAMGVVHRDVKPSNIILTPAGRAKLVDLGLARNDGSESIGELTLPGTTLGTFDYISPEQAKDPRSVDVRSDIYSLGCTMYHMLTGQPPYPEGTVLQKLLEHQSSESPDPAAVNPDVPPALSAVVRKMMNSDRSKRYQTADQLIRDLSLLAGKLGLRGVSPEGLVWVTSRSLRTSRWTSHVGWLATLGLLLIVAGVLQQFPDLSRRLAGGGPAELRVNDDPRGPALASDSPPAGRPLPPVSPVTQGATPAPLESASAPAAIIELSTVTPGRKPGTGTGKTAEPGRSTEPADASTQNPPAELTAIESFDERLKSLIGTTRIPDLSSLLSNSPPPAGRSKPAEASTPSGSEPLLADTQQPVLVLSEGGPPRRFRTLEAACAAAADGSIVEVAATRRLREKSFRLPQKNLTLRGASGGQPVIEFVPTELDAGSAGKGIITIPSGSVRLINLHFELLVPESLPVERMALFAVARPELLGMESVSVTVRNPRGLPVSIVQVDGESERMSPDMSMPASMNRDGSRLTLSNCVFRGEAALLNAAWKGSLTLSMTNCGLALSGDAVHLRAGSNTVSPDRLLMRLEMDHVTSLLGGSLLRFESLSADGAGQIRAEVRNSVFQMVSDQPVVASTPALAPEEARRMLVWRGERNFYGNASSLWTMGTGPEEMDFEEWKNHWGPADEAASSNVAVTLRSQKSGAVPVWSTVTTAGLGFDPGSATSNPALRSATDGEDAGVRLPLLPDFTPPATAAASAPAAPPAASATPPAAAQPGPAASPEDGPDDGSLP